MLNYFPTYFSKKAMAVYFGLLVLIPLLFGYPMTWYWWAFGIIEVVCFFIFTSNLSKSWSNISERNFGKSIFWLAFILRLTYVTFSYFFYINVGNSFFEFNAADSYTYHMFAEHGADMIKRGEFDFKHQFEALGYIRNVDVNDVGYPTMLSFWYFITNKSIFLARVMRSFVSAVTVVLMYRVAKSNFNNSVARITALFCAFMPNLIYYCSTGLKETDMLFVTVLFIERADSVLRGKVSMWQLVCVFLIGAWSFFYRGVLCAVLFLAFLTALLLSSQRIIPKVKKFAIAIMSLIILGISFGNNIMEQVDLSNLTDLQAQQEADLNWRAEREGGNQYASMAGKAVFAPLIFTIPFPTFVNIPGQESQQLLHGGNYVKNIMSFFTILALFLLLFSGEWKGKILPIAFQIGYLIVLVFSNFAQSERFHIPILPFSLMFAAYGITQLKNKHKRWFVFWLAFIFVANIGWTWFKLRGRGM